MFLFHFSFYVGIYVRGLVPRPASHGVLVYGETQETISCLASSVAHGRYNIYEDTEHLLHILEVNLVKYIV